MILLQSSSPVIKYVKSNKIRIVEPFERGEIFSQRAFSIFTDIRKLQEKAETSSTLITEEVEVLIWVTA